MAIETCLTVTLKIKGPIISRSSSPGYPGIDSPMARNASGQICIPRTLLKGRLVEALEELGGLSSSFKPDLKDLFGVGSDNSKDKKSGSVDPRRGRVEIPSDFLLRDQDDKTRLYRIRIDPEREAVETGAYQVIEAPVAPGRTVSFIGEISFISKDESSANTTAAILEKGLKWIGGLGALGSVGFGSLTGVEIQRRDFNLSGKPVAITTTDGTIPFTLDLLAPFCIARRRTAENLFESETAIPGGALKGSLAGTWRKMCGLPPGGPVSDGMDPSRPELCQNFACIRFTHAFPAVPASEAHSLRRPLIFPRSLIQDREHNFLDVARCACPVLVGKHAFQLDAQDTQKCTDCGEGPGHKNHPFAPAFWIDWKDMGPAQELMGWKEPEKELRVRTAISRTTRRAEEGKLFAYEMVVPGGRLWLGSIDLSRVDGAQREKVAAQLAGLLARPLHGLGKTKAPAQIHLLPPERNWQPYKKSCAKAMKDGLWIIALQSPALLCNPCSLAGQSSRAALHKAYDDDWKDISKKSLTLVRYFASQSLAGGFYLHRRFQPSKPYNPFLLTDEGSVFVLKASGEGEDDPEKQVARWLSHGLDLPAWVKTAYGEEWDHLPYIPQNGYGEIAVNLDLHCNLHKKEFFHEIAQLVEN